jgi:hypothetical protein
MFSITSFPELVTRSQAVVKVKILKVEPPDNDHWHVHLLTLEVQKRLLGNCSDKIEYIWGGNTAFVESPAYAVGEECYLCLVPDDREQGRYREVNFGHSKIGIQDEKVSLWERTIPENLKKRLAKLTTTEFEDWVIYLRGPEINVAPMRVCFACDEPFEFSVTINNRTGSPMLLGGGEGFAFGGHCDLMLWDANGFPCTSNWTYGGYKDYASIESFSDAHTDLVRIEPGQKFTGKARFFLPLQNFSQDPTSVRVAAIRYSPRTSGGKEKDIEPWEGSVQATCPLRLTCAYPRWAADLHKPSKNVSISLSLSSYTAAQVSIPKQGITLYVFLSPPSQPTMQEIGGSTDLLTPAEVKKAIFSCLRIERDGMPLEAQKADGDSVRAWFASRFPITDGKGALLDLAAYGNFGPGVYRVRLVLPGPDGDALSNVVQITVPEKNAP